ncbi:MAG: tyrosine-type recombinase/integrase [Proteobacteria bacterium]|nr:tyrosine-type recombinase/integrase [Pseudomonadota bacterium]MBI3497072.1 tyrosine-type recombinase/integrase [Pseudomonadota bacterium]
MANCPGVPVGVQDLRHTAASIGVPIGANLPVVGRLLGHSQASTTNRYAHVDIDPALTVADEIGATLSNAMRLFVEPPQSCEDETG